MDTPDFHTGEATHCDKPASSNTTKPRKALLNQLITLSAAQAEEEDMRVVLQYAQKRSKFYGQFYRRREEIQQLVAFHCGLTDPSSNLYDHMEPLTCAFPYASTVLDPMMLEDRYHPRNVEEKVRSEAATYIWIGENCPDVPIPALRGFGLPGGLTRIKFFIWSFARRLYYGSGSHASGYVPCKRREILDHGYLLMDWIENDDLQMLSTKFSKPHTVMQVENFYRGMSQIMISMARVSQPRIGSWTIDNRGQIALTNRPVLCHLHQLENWSIPSDIPRSRTYTSADSFYLDLLAGHDNRLRYQGNATTSEIDARGQATDLVLMRALLHQFTNRHLRDGPFIMQLTDMHDSNILVDKDWNIKYVIDLEWACSLPLDALLPPFWLTGKTVDRLHGDEYTRFKAQYSKFVEIFEQEERSTVLHQDGNFYSRGATMRTALEDGRYWYLNALQSPKGLFNLFRRHLQARFDEVSGNVLCAGVSPFWTPGMTSFVQSKLDNHTQYLQELVGVFTSEKSGRPY
ncbi:hypothetical protein CISG_05456 [Coccidioides immitis RMSCC 3703]|uniref:Aminoglycoside phosphotransferase domain-containing protein n=1 Tax=Coccidioides immitis RMSCC 3703 TaxID=454286 RepID=A0A0J8QU33_COCIT|nr:hypothetical protein CISG_05456 [Coccidioides immitis RMSCC 3703]